MTSEEMERAMQFILDHQAEYEAKNELEKKELRDNIQSLTNAVGVLAIQADKDRDEMKVAINQLSATATAINNAVMRQEVRNDRMEDQAEKDRQAMLSAVERIETQAEKDRATTSARLDRMEAQAEKDRQEMRSAITSMNNSVTRLETQADKDRATIANAISELVKGQRGLSNRITELEDKKS